MASRTIDFAKTHFKKITDDPVRILVDEWQDEDGKAVEIFFTPITMKQMQLIKQKTKDDEVAATIEILIMKARKQDGSAHFTIADKPELLRHADMKIIGRVVKEIVGDQFYEEESIDEFEKN